MGPRRNTKDIYDEENLRVTEEFEFDDEGQGVIER